MGGMPFHPEQHVNGRFGLMAAGRPGTLKSPPGLLAPVEDSNLRRGFFVLPNRRAANGCARPRSIPQPPSPKTAGATLRVTRGIDELRALRRRAMVETEQERAMYYEILREVRALLKRVDEILARR